MSDSAAEKRAKAWVGQTLRGKWSLERLIGMGGMANVYAARHRNGREVAVKLLLPEFGEFPEVRERFLREGYIANRIEHPGVVGILDDDVTEDGLSFLVMELLQGVSLLERLDTVTPLPLSEALFIADQLLDTLGAAHAAGVVHRDIKPGNVFLMHDGRVKVLDFGLARVLDCQAQALTRQGLVLGTVSYMAPEQARAMAEGIDARTDIYAVGSTLFVALSGQFVHEARNVMDRLRAVSTMPARSLGSVTPDMHPRVIDLVDKALKFLPAERWQDAFSMQVEVRRAFLEHTGHPIPETRRVTMHGMAGWSRAASPLVSIGQASGDNATGLDVSVVFEPLSNRDGLSIPIVVVGE